MGCLTENEVVEFFLPGRPAALAARVDAHTAQCERCRQLLADYARISTMPAGGAPLGVGTAAPVAVSFTSEATQPDRLALIQRLAQAQARKYIGQVLKGKWEIEELIGSGGMAHVYAARHRNGRRFAIKFLRPELIAEPTIVQRFLREGYIANKLEHPGAVTILDDDVTEDGAPFVVMELLIGRTLRARLDAAPLPLEEALRLIAQVLDVLAIAHEKGIVHRDLKPDNLFETQEGMVKVLDFGIARLKERTRPELESRSGTMLGTPGFMPPEQARGLSAEVDARSDVWAMGATVYNLLTGRTLHVADTLNQALLLAMTKPVEPMARLLPNVPASIQQWLDRALAFDPAQRFRDAREMKSAMPMLSASEHHVRATPARRTRIGLGLGLGLGATVVAIAGGAYFFRARPPVQVAAPPPASSPAISIVEPPMAAPSASVAPVPSASASAAPVASVRKPAGTRPKPVRPSPAPAPDPPPAESRDPLAPRL
jgi:serine/threonine-protein kinase